MTRTFALLLPALLVGVGVQAATTQTTLTVTNAPVTLSGTSASVSGTATLSGIGSGSFSASASLTSLSGTTLTAPFTIQLSGGNLTGTLSIPVTLFLGSATSGTGSATVTGGTGSYAGASGSFPSLNGTVSGGIATQDLKLSFSGAGSITTGGSGTGNGGGPTATTPAITAVLDAGSYTSNIAEGSIFVVKGTNLSSSGYNSFSFPLPTTSSTSDKVKITFTPAAGGAGTDAYLIYTYNQGGVNQLAAILPSSLAAGNYNVTVTSNGTTSAPFAATVVQRKGELLTQDASGSGLVLTQNVVSASQYDVTRFTTGTVSGITISPAHPGQTLVAYGTGLGPVSGGDNVASSGFDFTKNGATVAAVVGGVSIPALYAGRTPTLAGLDQINFTLPSDVPTGCTVSFQISVNGQLSAPTFIAIAPDPSASACVQPGLTTQQLQDFDNGKAITSGAFTLSQLQMSVPSFGSVKIDSVGGGFAKYTGFQLASFAQQQAQVSSSGACTVLHFSGSATQAATGGMATGLDAGGITLSGPGVTNLALKQDSSNFYNLSLGTEGISIPGTVNVTLSPGTYTLSGAGGADVGAFTAKVNMGAPLTITGGLPASVTRSAGLPLAWTGGTASDRVSIVGYSGTSSGSGANATVDATEFICTTTAGAGSFTVPASVLNQLPVSTNSGNSTGFLEVISSTAPSSGNGQFSAPLKAGGTIDNALFLATSGTGAQVSYQ